MTTSQLQFEKSSAEQTPPSKDEMIPCGTHSMRGAAEDRTVDDGINGTISLKPAYVESAKAGAGEPIWVRAEANDESVNVIREIHANGRSINLPVEQRKELELTPDDEVDIWILAADVDSTEQITDSDKTNEENQMDRRVIIFADEQFTYHYVEDQGTTNCGISLDNREYRDGSDEMPEMFDKCTDCVVRSSQDMTNKEIIDWFSNEAGFGKSGGAPSYMSHEQLVAIRDKWMDMKDKISELEEEVNN